MILSAKTLNITAAWQAGGRPSPDPTATDKPPLFWA
jgi:hypothetical protein